MSIKQSMLLISISAIIISFIITLICFNFITKNYLKAQISEEFDYAIENKTKLVSSIAVIDNVTFDFPDNQNFEGKKRSIRVLNMIEFLKETNSIETIVVDKQGELIFPINSEDTRIEVLLKSDCSKLNKLYINNIAYYVLRTNLNTTEDIILFKNVQDLSEMIYEFNSVLFLLLSISSIIIISVVVLATNSIMKAVKTICLFVEEIGEGNFETKNLKLSAKEFKLLEYNLNKMATKLSEYDSEQKIFFQNASHELRTPLMSIQGYAEGIKYDVFMETKSIIDIILSETNKLSNMICDILYISKIDTNKFNLNRIEFDLREIILEIIDDTKIVALNKKIIFNDLAKQILFYGNPKEIKRAILNIYLNCVKYSTSKVIIECNNKEIIIRDDGNGIDDEDIKNIFKRFYKGKNGCNGVGLAISYTVFKNHGGAVSVTNNNGAVFKIKLKD